MKTIKLLTLLAIFIGFSSCSDNDDDDPTLQVETEAVANLYAPQLGGQGQPISGDYTKFNFSTGAVTTSTTDWDIAFRGTDIILNGGVSSGGTDEPARNGNASGYIANGTMTGITSVNTTLLEEDSLNAHVLANWYTYTGPPNHLILPTAGKIFVIKTRDGKYAKIEILSYYKDAPEEITLDIATNDARYFTFNYVYQPNEGVTTF
jgi:hypothetical protein